MGKKISTILIALVYMALGVLFIVRPRGVEEVLCYVLAIALAVFGLLYLIGYLIASTSDDGSVGNGFAIGVLMLMMAVFIIAKQDLIITLVPFLFGVMVMIRGLFTIQTAFRVKRRGFSMKVPLILGLVIMAFGLFIMLYPLESGEILFIVIGCGLLAAGISGLIEEISVNSMHRKHEHALERARDMEPAIKTYDVGDDEVEVVDEAEAVKADDVATRQMPEGEVRSMPEAATEAAPETETEAASDDLSAPKA